MVHLNINVLLLVGKGSIDSGVNIFFRSFLYLFHFVSFIFCHHIPTYISSGH